MGWWIEPLGRGYGELQRGLEQVKPCSLFSCPFSETTHLPDFMHGFIASTEGMVAN